MLIVAKLLIAKGGHVQVLSSDVYLAIYGREGLTTGANPS